MGLIIPGIHSSVTLSSSASMKQHAFIFFHLTARSIIGLIPPAPFPGSDRIKAILSTLSGKSTLLIISKTSSAALLSGLPAQIITLFLSWKYSSNPFEAFLTTFSIVFTSLWKGIPTTTSTSPITLAFSNCAFICLS